MKRSISIAALIFCGALATAGMAVAETTDAQEMAMFSNAKIDIGQALSIAANSKAKRDGPSTRPWRSLLKVRDHGAVIDTKDGPVIAKRAHMDDRERRPRSLVEGLAAPAR
jgi:hypothetical protein